MSFKHENVFLVMNLTFKVSVRTSVPIRLQLYHDTIGGINGKTFLSNCPRNIRDDSTKLINHPSYIWFFSVLL